MAARSIVQKLGNRVKEVAKNKSSSWWYTPHMAAASRAIAERIPLVDLVLEIRDARVPLSSGCNHLGALLSSSRRIIVLNKMDLAKQSNVKEWTTYFDQQNCVSFGVNAHNKDNIHEFLNFLQARVRELTKTTRSDHTCTIMLVGIPNVGKSALANSLHQVGRISAAEKGKLKHAIVSPEPGETRNISSLKIASHPNIYVLDTPGILPPEILTDEVCLKLALTGAINDYIVGKIELAKYFLSVLNRSDEYKKWEKFTAIGNINNENEASASSHMERSRRRQNDHTQDFIVNDVRGALYNAVSSFNGDLENEEDLLELIEAEFSKLRNAFRIGLQSAAEEHDDDRRHSSSSKVAIKLLDLYRTGRLGHYILDSSIPS
ncbi:hypothetical protein M9H77_33602 [Catharanthus roseus]|uniref:Uncharacterized protein n=1 Tax=Catharanthus roseus TaxID=4058 RepID=A0ACB9ZN15_CATRO|nr:hypothetical protein M9H77_33602 [Catharanthus roseus]